MRNRKETRLFNRRRNLQKLTEVLKNLQISFLSLAPPKNVLRNVAREFGKKCGYLGRTNQPEEEEEQPLVASSKEPPREFELMIIHFPHLGYRSNRAKTQWGEYRQGVLHFKSMSCRGRVCSCTTCILLAQAAPGSLTHGSATFPTVHITHDVASVPTDRQAPESNVQ